MNNLVDLLPVFITLSGFIVGLGAVTVIDSLGFLGRKSSYWTEATIRAHKVTKPLIWIGTTLLICGTVLMYSRFGYPSYLVLQLISFFVMILNGVFLSFYVSPKLLQQEQDNRSGEVLPANLQLKITFSFIISFVCWWGNVLLVSYYLLNLNQGCCN
jgi:hypothetical protein